MLSELWLRCAGGSQPAARGPRQGPQEGQEQEARDRAQAADHQVSRIQGEITSDGCLVKPYAKPSRYPNNNFLFYILPLYYTIWAILF